MIESTRRLDWLQELHSNGMQLTTRELLAYTQYARLFDLQPKARIQAQLSGAYLSRAKGRGMEFDEARHYQPGDDVRNIDWRVTAKMGKTHTKVYREERERPVFVVCDLRASMHFGTQLLLKSVQAAHIAAIVGWSAIERGDKIGALILGQQGHMELKPASRKKAVLNLIQQLVAMHANDDNSNEMTVEPLVSHLQRLRRLARPGSLVVLISDFADLDDAAIQQLMLVKRHCEIRAMLVTDPIEKDLPGDLIGQPLTFQNASSAARITVASRNDFAQYNTVRHQHFDAMTKRLSPCLNSLTEISAAQPLMWQWQQTTGVSPWIPSAS